MKYILSIMIALCSLEIGYAQNYFVDSLEQAQSISSDTGQPILLIFGSPRCQFCQVLKNDLKNSDLKLTVDKCIICYLNIEDDKTYQTTFQISSLPNSRIIHKKHTISTMTGYNKKDYTKWLRKNLP